MGEQGAVVARGRSYSFSVTEDVIVVQDEIELYELTADCVCRRNRANSMSATELLRLHELMEEQAPRYGLRPSPMKLAPAPRQAALDGRPQPPLPPRAHNSPNRFAAIARAQSSIVLPVGRDGAAVGQRSEQSTAFRKLNFAAAAAPAGGSAQPKCLPTAVSSTNLLPSRPSSSNLGERSLRKNATFFSATSGSFISRSSACLPVLPLRETVAETPAATEPAAAPPVPPPRRRSKSNLEPLAAAAAGEAAGEKSVAAFPRAFLPPKPPLALQKSQSVQQLQQAEGSGLKRSGLGLARSQATTRLQPLSRVLQEEEEESSAAPAASVAPVAAPAETVVAAAAELKRPVPPPVPPRRTLVPSASVACIKATERERPSRPLLRPASPSASTLSGVSAAVRIRPPSPSRAAKERSGLLRSSTSVIIGAAAGLESAASAAQPLVQLQQLQRLPESPTKRAKTSVAPRLPPKPAHLLKQKGTVVEGVVDTVVSTVSIVLDKERTPKAATPRQRLAPSPSAGSLRKRPSTSKIVRSASSTVLSIDRVEGTVAEGSQLEEQDTVVLPPARPPKPQQPLQPQGPPPSPLTRSLKRRLNSTEEQDGEERSTTVMQSTGRSMNTASTALPPASFFLRDEQQPAADAAGAAGAAGTTSAARKGATPLSRKGNDSFLLPTPTSSSCMVGDSTPKPARRSKKMRRLEMESGEVEEEVRELALEHAAAAAAAASPSKPRPRSSPCKVAAAGAASGSAAPAAGAARSLYETTRDVEMADDSAGPSTSTATRVLQPVALPPPPGRSAMRRARVEVERGTRSIHFAHVDVFLFARMQGYLAVPSSGEVCLGMEATHHDEERHRLDGRVEEVEEEGGGGMYGEDEEDLSDGEIRPLHRARMPACSSPRRLPPGEKYTTRHIEPLSSKARSRMLRQSGVKMMRDPTAAPEHESIRQRRRECGCSCEGGRCIPGVCECSRDGIACQVDTEEGPFPCRCRADSCQNDQGRVEFNAQHVFEHYQRTFARLRTIERLGDDTRGSPTHIKFVDEEEGARPVHNATSYLATPPPKIYQSTFVLPSPQPAAAACDDSTAAAATTNPPRSSPRLSPKKSTTIVQQSSQLSQLQSLCTPPSQPVQQLQQEKQEERAADAAGIAEQALTHPRFPVTPVYKKYAGAGGGELPLSRMAIFNKSAAAAAAPAAAPAASLAAEEDLDESMDYATPPEGRSPAQTAAAAAEPAPPSPRKFAFFQSILGHR